MSEEYQRDVSDSIMQYKSRSMHFGTMTAEQTPADNGQHTHYTQAEKAF